MRKLTTAALPTRCRICLKKLQEKSEIIYNVHLVPNLAHLLLSYLLVDVKDDDDLYPKNLCRECYDRLQDILTFRNLACKTANALIKILNNAVPPPSKTLAAPTRSLETSSNSLASPTKTLESASNSFESANDMSSTVVKEPTQRKSKRSTNVITPVVVIPLKRRSLKSTAVILPPAPIMEDNRRKSKRNQPKEQDDDDQLIIPSPKKPKFEPIEENEKEIEMADFDMEPLEQSSSYGDEDNATDADNSIVPAEMLLMEHSNVYDIKTEFNRSDTNPEENNVVKTESMLTEQNTIEESECNSTDADKQPMVNVKLENPVSTNGMDIPLQEMLALHMKQINSITPVDGEHICQICNSKLANRKSFLSHLKRHDTNRKHVCKICGVAKIRKTELKIHMQTHNPNAPRYKCPRCPKVFKHKNAIMRHISAVHDRIRLHACAICSRSFATLISKINHERLHTGEKPYACEDCDMRFSSADGLYSHRQSHDLSLRRFVCKYCSHRCITRKNLEEHEVRHVQDLPHRCNVCGLGFVQPKVMLRHQAKHTPAEVAAADAKKSMEKTANTNGSKKRKRSVLSK